MNKEDTMRNYAQHFILALLVFLPATIMAAPSGQALSFTCAGCHGTDGSSVGPSMPAIAGMDPEVFVDAMKAYRNDQRNATIMNRIAKAYSDEQFKSMAWFFASQHLYLKPQDYNEALAARGKILHDAHCEKCHENDGRPGDAGTLAGQWMPYMEYTMDDFMKGKRKWPRKMKRKVDAAIAEDGQDAVTKLIHFYGSQQ
ncbi:MAG: hypothetical protein GY694_07545 [Gammaproteobacteria bacterium]|nr:hypothetical protein [Gammaproteobacteria bacterium]